MEDRTEEKNHENHNEIFFPLFTSTKQLMISSVTFGDKKHPAYVMRVIRPSKADLVERRPPNTRRF